MDNKLSFIVKWCHRSNEVFQEMESDLNSVIESECRKQRGKIINRIDTIIEEEGYGKKVFLLPAYNALIKLREAIKEGKK